MTALTWSGFTLLDPWFLLAIPIAFLAVVYRALRRRAALPTAAVALFDGVPRTIRQRLAWLPAAIKLVAVTCLGVALARPVERLVVPIEEDGLDILLVVDTSTSMNTKDMSETKDLRRMDAARRRAEEFAAERVNDRVGLVAFARFAELRCPLTLDESALAAFLRSLDVVPEGSQLDGTAVGTALAKAVQVLQDSTAESKVVVLLTDGETTVFDIAPEDGAKLAADAGIRVHTVGLGRGLPTPFGFRALDFSDLRMIAEKTGGEFFEPKSDDDLAAVYERIDELEKTELEDPRYRTVDRFEWPLGLGLLVLLLALGLEVLVFRRVP
ncbi:MAG: VWA domain-containing protein [bacterium]|nr:VWA domain-containing protein [bacterium]